MKRACLTKTQKKVLFRKEMYEKNINYSTLWSKVMVTVTSFLYVTFCHVQIHIPVHTKYEGTGPPDKKVLHQTKLCLQIEETSIQHINFRNNLLYSELSLIILI